MITRSPRVSYSKHLEGSDQTDHNWTCFYQCHHCKRTTESQGGAVYKTPLRKVTYTFWEPYSQQGKHLDLQGEVRVEAFCWSLASESVLCVSIWQCLTSTTNRYFHTDINCPCIASLDQRSVQLGPHPCLPPGFHLLRFLSLCAAPRWLPSHLCHPRMAIFGESYICCFQGFAVFLCFIWLLVVGLTKISIHIQRCHFILWDAVMDIKRTDR